MSPISLVDKNLDVPSGIMKNGDAIGITTEQYVDGGLIRDYSIDILDAVKYQRFLLPQETLQVSSTNYKTLGFRLKPSLPEESAEADTVQSAKDLGMALSRIYFQVEREYLELKGEDSRTVEINDKGVGTLDFDIDPVR